VRILAPRAGKSLERVHDVRRLVRPSTERLGREVRRVGLGEDAVGKDLRCREPQIRRVLVRRVAGERDVVPALEHSGQCGGIGEAVQHDGAVERGELLEHVLVGRAVVNHDRFPELTRELELLPEERALAVVWRVVTVEVEAGLTHRDRAWVGEQVAHRVEVVVVCRLVRVDSENREHLRVLLCELERRVASLDRRTDRENPPHARLARTANELAGWIRARVEVRMGVDHAAVAGASRRGKSGCAASIPPAGTVFPTATFSHERSSG
jgi:hypothetical protein